MPSSRHILFSGGGTLGSVTPLLAVADAFRRRDAGVRLSWVGTPDGPERLLIDGAKIDFLSLGAPKFDRTRPWRWPLIPFLFVKSLLRAWRLLGVLQPDLVVSAGGYVAVPVAYAAWLRRIPVWVHQLDAVPGLANRLVAPFATRVSVTFAETAKHFAKAKTLLVGGMVRSALRSGNKETARALYGFDADKPTILIMGGGTGALSVNQAVASIRGELVRRANVLHLVGRGKMLAELEESLPGYVALEFLHEGMTDAFALADVVVARAGLGTICELVALGKPSIVIPFGDAFQRANAQLLIDAQAAEVLWHVSPQILLDAIRNLLTDLDHRAMLSTNIRALFPTNADDRIVHEVLELIH